MCSRVTVDGTRLIAQWVATRATLRRGPRNIIVTLSTCTPARRARCSVCPRNDTPERLTASLLTGPGDDGARETRRSPRHTPPRARHTARPHPSMVGALACTMASGQSATWTSPTSPAARVSACRRLHPPERREPVPLKRPLHPRRVAVDQRAVAPQTLSQRQPPSPQGRRPPDHLPKSRAAQASRLLHLVADAAHRLEVVHGSGRASSEAAGRECPRCDCCRSSRRPRRARGAAGGRTRGRGSGKGS